MRWIHTWAIFSACLLYNQVISVWMKLHATTAVGMRERKSDERTRQQEHRRETVPVKENPLSDSRYGLLRLVERRQLRLEAILGESHDNH